MMALILRLVTFMGHGQGAIFPAREAAKANFTAATPDFPTILP
jgi:hypothetical protein